MAQKEREAFSELAAARAEREAAGKNPVGAPAGDAYLVDVEGEEEREPEDAHQWFQEYRSKGWLEGMVARQEMRPREAAFVLEYMRGGGSDAAGAAIRAGYSPAGAATQAHRMLRRANVQDAIVREMEEQRIAAGVGRGYLMRSWRDIADSPSQKTQDRLRALEDMARAIGAFAPEEVRHTHQGLAWADIARESIEGQAERIRSGAQDGGDAGEEPASWSEI